jgi:hypothetical protein
MQKFETGVENYALDRVGRAGQSCTMPFTRSQPVPVKFIVLYPRPLSEADFERSYHGEHLPLMRSLIVPAERLRTFKLSGPAGAPFYRLAEVDFPNIEELYAFVRSGPGAGARRSAQKVSTGGTPLVFVCAPDEVPARS